MFKRILLGLVVVLLIFLGVVAMQPPEFSVVRTATLPASPSDVFPHVNDFHAWEAWSPWARLDPKAKNSFEGPESGVGSIFKWSGNSDVGEGSMKITDSQPPELIRIQLDFTKPFAGTNQTEFTFKPTEGDQTLVTWSMVGKKNFICKGICLFMSMDKMVGGQFEQGLANLKEVVAVTNQSEEPPVTQ